MMNLRMAGMIETDVKRVVISITKAYPFNFMTIAIKGRTVELNYSFKKKVFKVEDFNEFKGMLRTYCRNYRRVYIHFRKEIPTQLQNRLLVEIKDIFKSMDNIFQVNDAAYFKWYSERIDMPLKSRLNEESVDTLNNATIGVVNNLLCRATGVPKSGLDAICDGNLYCFLDCEYTGFKLRNRHMVRQIAVTYCIREEDQLKVVAKYYKSSQSTFDVCREFAEYSQVFTEELLAHYDLHKAIYVGNGVQDDFENIYNSAHQTCPAFEYINTASAAWVDCWDQYVLSAKSGCSLSDLGSAFKLTEAEVAQIVKKIYNLNSVKYHNAAFDSIALIILINIMFMQRYKKNQFKIYVKSRY